MHYSRDWPETYSMLDIELACYRHKVTLEQGGLGPVQHFINACDIIWPEGNRMHVIWHPWALDMITKAIELQDMPNTNSSLAVAGAASSGKSFTFGAYAIVNWLVDPDGTMVLVTSTTLKESRKRIWGVICKMFSHAEVTLPGKLVDSQGAIRTVVPGMKPNDMSGIHLIAGEKKKEKAAIDKMIGIKAPRVFLVADELTSLSPAVVEAGANLQNNPFFQLVGLGNSNTVYDPHGVLSEPIDGWKSIDTERLPGWRTKAGWCLRFDAEQSPNYLAGDMVYPFMPTREMVEQAKIKFGERSRSYYRMYRSIWFSDDEDLGIFTEADLLRAKFADNIRWLTPPHPCAGVDLGYSNHGDRTIFIHGLCGIDIHDTPRLIIKGYHRLLEDSSMKDVPRNFQIARQVAQLCQKYGIDSQHLAIDGTGSAGSFVDILTHEWKPGTLSVLFGGWPTERTVRFNNKLRPASEVYANRASELWGETKHFVSNGQIVGVFPEMGQELTTRKFMEKTRGEFVLLAVETKKDLRKRTGKSCDIADAALVLVDLCRTRLGFKLARKAPVDRTEDFLGEALPKSPQVSNKRQKWRQLVRKADIDSASGNFLVDERSSSLSLW